MPALDIFSGSAFSMVALTDAINKMPYVPGRIGQLGLFREQGVSTTSVMIEEREGSLNLVETTARGAPAVQNTTNKRKARSLVVPHIALEDTILADEVQNVRAFGSESMLEGVEAVVNQRLSEMATKMDATLEHLRIGAITYNAASGYTRTAIRGTADLAVDNLDVESVFSDEGITEEDLRAGKYDFAEVRMFLVNYESLGQGILKLRRGWLGEVTVRDGMYVAELRGMTQRLQMTVGEVYAPDCSADLGDARCGVNLAALEETGTVGTVTSATAFETVLAQVTGWYDGGELAWTGGANAGQTVAVRSWDAGTGMLTLFLPALYPMQAGDSFTIRPGCDKTFATCRAKFDNAVNFRGFPHVPGSDQVLSYPDAQS